MADGVLSGAAAGAAAGSVVPGIGNLIGAGIGALSGLAGNLIQNASAKKQQARQQEYNKEMLRIQNDYNTQMFNAANEWNSPVNERARLEAAGINPLNMQGDAGAANAPQSASANPLNMYPAINPAANIKELALATAQLENLRADTAKKSNESLSEVQRRENMAQELLTEKEQLNLIKSQANVNEKTAAQIQKVIDWYDRLQEANIERSKSESKLNDTQKKRIEALLPGEKELQDMSIDDFEHRWNALAATAVKDRALAALTNKEIKYYALSLLNDGIGKSGVSLRNVLIGYLLRSDPDMPDDVRSALEALLGSANPKSRRPRQRSPQEGAELGEEPLWNTD